MANTNKVRVILNRPWMGHWTGDSVEVSRVEANLLAQSGTAYEAGGVMAAGADARVAADGIPPAGEPMVDPGTGTGTSGSPSSSEPTSDAESVGADNGSTGDAPTGAGVDVVTTENAEDSQSSESQADNSQVDTEAEGADTDADNTGESKASLSTTDELSKLKLGKNIIASLRADGFDTIEKIEAADNETLVKLKYITANNVADIRQQVAHVKEGELNSQATTERKAIAGPPENKSLSQPSENKTVTPVSTSNIEADTKTQTEN